MDRSNPKKVQIAFRTTEELKLSIHIVITGIAVDMLNCTLSDRRNPSNECFHRHDEHLRYVIFTS